MGHLHKREEDIPKKAIDWKVKEEERKTSSDMEANGGEGFDGGRQRMVQL